MKVATPLAKNVLALLGITPAASAKENIRFRDNNLNSFKRRNEWHNENSSTS